jgi:hypothetical protein
VIAQTRTNAPVAALTSAWTPVRTPRIGTSSVTPSS